VSFYLAEKKIREGQLFRGFAAARSGQSTTLLLMDHEKGKEQNQKIQFNGRGDEAGPVAFIFGAPTARIRFASGSISKRSG
jgi:hypothetical protein